MFLFRAFLVALYQSPDQCLLVIRVMIIIASEKGGHAV